MDACAIVNVVSMILGPGTAKLWGEDVSRAEA